MEVTYEIYEEAGTTYRRGSDGSIWALDPGGETRWGISKRSYPNVDIKNLPKEAAANIYFNDFWKASGADRLPWPLCLSHLDSSVNCGVGQALRFLHESNQDFDTYNQLRRDFYMSLHQFQSTVNRGCVE